MTTPSREKMPDSRTTGGLRNITNCRASLTSGGLVSYEWEELAAEEKVNCHRRSIGSHRTSALPVGRHADPKQGLPCDDELLTLGSPSKCPPPQKNTPAPSPRPPSFYFNQTYGPCDSRRQTRPMDFFLKRRISALPLQSTHTLWSGHMSFPLGLVETVGEVRV